MIKKGVSQLTAIFDISGQSAFRPEEQSSWFFNQIDLQK